MTPEESILAELRKLNEALTAPKPVEPPAWTPKTLAAHYGISVRAAERIIHKYGVVIDRERRLPDWKKRKLEETGPHYLATFGR